MKKILFLTVTYSFIFSASADENYQTKDLLGYGMMYKYSKAAREGTKHIDGNKYWELSISKNTNKLFSFYVNRSPVKCGKNPPIDKLSFLLRNNRQYDIPIFCGSIEGHHNTIFMINPVSQKLASIDVGNGLVSFIKENNKYYLFSLQEQLVGGSEPLLVSYSVLHEISLSEPQLDIEIKIANDQFSRERYQQKIKAKPTQKKELYNNIIYLGFLDNQMEYCKEFKKIPKNNAEALRKLFNFKKCD